MFWKQPDVFKGSSQTRGRCTQTLMDKYMDKYVKMVLPLNKSVGNRGCQRTTRTEAKRTVYTHSLMTPSI